jgi:predicted hydrocarbon binding protein
MSRHSRTVPAGKRFLTGHSLFDRIVNLNFGSSNLMLDETFSEANKLLHVLLENYGGRHIKRHFEVVPYPPQSIDEHVFGIEEKPLSDISIGVNQIRSQHPDTPIIHTALPDMIMKNDPEDLLRLLMAWQKNIRAAGTIEFYILPKGTFQDLERKILAVVDGGMEIRVDQTENRFRSYLKPIRSCSPDAHLKEFQYILDNRRFLLLWNGQFTDELGTFDVEEVKNRVDDYKKNLRFLKVIAGERFDTQMSVYEYWMISQIREKSLSELKEIFPEDFDEILQKIASWQVADVVRVVQSPKPWKPSYTTKTQVSRRTSLALSLPVWLTSRLLRFMTGRPRTIPLDAFLYNRKATLAFIDMLLARLDLQDSDYTERLLEMQKRFYEVGSRETALKHTKAIGENVSLNMDLKHLPKLLELTLISSYNSKPEIRKLSEKEYMLTFRECYECDGVKYSKPACSPIEGIVEGICGVIFKVRARCHEIECKALGDDACLFRLEID